LNCHTSSPSGAVPGANSIALVGHPNVGKSVLFSHLTGKRVMISNYPGTTVEVARGKVSALQNAILVDTPGVVTFPPRSEDELVTARFLINEPLKAVIQVGDAKNLRRTLSLTVQLAEMGLPMALSLNMMDEADSRGVRLDHNCLGEAMGISVVPTAAVHGRGIKELISCVQTASAPALLLEYPYAVESVLQRIIPQLPQASISPRSLALLWLSGDPVSETYMKGHLRQEEYQSLLAMRESILEEALDLPGQIQVTRQAFVDKLVNLAVLDTGEGWKGISKKIGYLATHPVWGIGILALVLYSIYWFVGVFGAGTLVGILEENLFGGVINPWVTGMVEKYISIPLVADLLVGEYGIWTMGMTYAIALILPIVTTFFLAFGIMEDSGYLPRLAALSNRIFRFLGLNGKAVLPMVLGLGCVTMATLTTRVLEKKRERLLVTLLLALAVPCSAQLGVVMGMLAGISLSATLIWSGVVMLILLAIGWLAARLVPGERTQLLVEMPPLRMPVISNVVVKTLARLEWYLKEVVPLFIVGTLILFVLDKTAILDWIIRIGEPLVSGWLGLPAQASAAFLIGFMRRDFGATGLFLMEAQGLLNPAQVVVAMVTITLFIPCVASIMMIAKERGWRTAAGMVVLIIPLAFLIGGLLNKALLFIGWGV